MGAAEVLFKLVRIAFGKEENCSLPCGIDWTLDGILTHPKSCTTLASKVLRYFTSRWRYRMVYNDSMLLTSFHLAKSYRRLQDKGAASIREKYFFANFAP